MRTFSNYLTPRLGFFSADTWTLGATLLRNMLLNWIVLVSWLAALLLIPRFCALVALAQPHATTLNALLVGAFAGIAIGTAYAAIDLPSLGNARWPQKRFVAGWLVPMFGGVACFLAWWAGLRNTDEAALSLMLSEAGLHTTQLFVGAATAAGCALAACVVAYRTHSKKAPRPPLSRLLALAGILLITVLLTGVLSGYFAWWVVARVFPDPARDAQNFICFAAPLLLALYFSANALFIGLTSWFGADEDLRWWGRAGAWLCIAILSWAALHALALWVPPLVARINLGEFGKTLLAVSGGVIGLRRSRQGGHAVQRLGFASETARGGGARFFCAAFLRALALAGRQKRRPRPLRFDLVGDLGKRRVFEAAELPCSARRDRCGDGLLINVNKFSLHAMYRNRLIGFLRGGGALGRRTFARGGASLIRERSF